MNNNKILTQNNSNKVGVIIPILDQNGQKQINQEICLSMDEYSTFMIMLTI
jgi:phosphoketolase